MLSLRIQDALATVFPLQRLLFSSKHLAELGVFSNLSRILIQTVCSLISSIDFNFLQNFEV